MSASRLHSQAFRSSPALKRPGTDLIRVITHLPPRFTSLRSLLEAAQPFPAALCYHCFFYYCYFFFFFLLLLSILLTLVGPSYHRLCAVLHRGYWKKRYATRQPVACASRDLSLTRQASRTFLPDHPHPQLVYTTPSLLCPSLDTVP